MTHTVRKVLSAVAALLFVSTGMAAPKAVRSIEGIDEYRLANGLQVLLVPDDTQQTMTVNLTYKVGSSKENYGETGMAHLLEHLMFKGSKNHTNIPKELSDHGARPNGSTWVDRTNYFETFTATEENLDWALSLEADRMVHSFISRKDLDSEMTVARNEFEAGENRPFSVLLEKMMATAYQWHSYGNTTIGARSDIENVPIQRLQAFYHQYYQPDNAVLIVAGKIDPGKTLQRISQYFAVIPRPRRDLPKTYTEEPAQAGPRQVEVRRVADEQIVNAMYHIPAGSSPEYAAVAVLVSVLGTSPSGRLHKALVETKLAARSYGFAFQWADPGVATLGASLDKTARMTNARDALLKVVEGIKKQPITRIELTRAKRKLLKDFELAFNSSERIALQLSEWIGMGDWRLMFLHRDHLEKVRLEDVQRVAERYFVANNRTLGLFEPVQKIARVAIARATSPATQLKGYQGRKAVAKGEAFEASYSNIERHLKRITLSSGARVILLPRKTRGHSVRLTANFGLGNLSALHGSGVQGEAVGSMLLRGTQKHSRTELKDQFDALKATVRVNGGVDSATASAVTTREYLSGVIDLLAEVMQQPAFPDKELDLLKAESITGLDQTRQNPQALAFREFRRRLTNVPKDHPLYVGSIDETMAQWKTLDRQQLLDFYHRFYGAGAAVVTVIGDFDEDTVTAALQKAFNGFQASVPYTRISLPFKAGKTRPDTFFDTPDKDNAVFIASTAFAMQDTDPRAAAMDLGIRMFGGGFLSSRLATRLRQKDGLSYGVGAFGNASPWEARGFIGAFAIGAPQNLDRIKTGFVEEAQRVVDGGFAQKELDDAKKGMLQGFKVRLAKDAELASMLTRNERLGRTLEWDRAHRDKIAGARLAQVNSVMARLLQPGAFSIVMAGDRHKKETVKTK